MLKTLKRIDYNYLFCYLAILVFFMRWDVYYTNNLQELLLKRLPSQLLCLVLGLGLSFIIHATIVKERIATKLIIGGTYFGLLYVALNTTGILWNHFSDLQEITLLSIIIGLVRIIQKFRIGMFSEGNKKYLPAILIIIMGFFITIDIAFIPTFDEKRATVVGIPTADETAIWHSGNDILQGLNSSQWDKLTLQDKLDLMQTVINIEIKHLGLDQGLPVKATGLGRNINAAYDKKLHTVYINEKRLEYATAKEMLASVTHEAYHAYQAKIVETYYLANEEQRKLYHYRKLEQYKKEMNNYINGREDYEKYYDQFIERDARYYGAERAVYYQQKLGLK